MENSFQCRFCLSNELKTSLPVREMMYGTRDVFDYQQCESCGSVQIASIPDDLGKFYPDDYYSMNKKGPAGSSPLSKLRAVLELQRDRRCVGLPAPLGGLAARLRPPPEELVALAKGRARRDDRILDVGCGASAHFLRRLARLGFTRLTGADPFIPSDKITHGPVEVLRRRLDELEGPYDVITLNHSFEHLPDPRAAIAEIDRLLAPGGVCILRVPTPSSEAFDRYGADWVQLDAPRHLNLPSRDGIAALAREGNMEIVEVIDNSSAFQFTGSELYRRDIPLCDAAAEQAIADEDRLRFAALARELNRQGRGDQAAFLLRKAA